MVSFFRTGLKAVRNFKFTAIPRFSNIPAETFALANMFLSLMSPKKKKQQQKNNTITCLPVVTLSYFLRFLCVD